MQAFTPPPRCTIANVETGETLVCFFNPTQLQERIEVGYQRLMPLGQGAEALHYQGTRNRTVPGVELYAEGFRGEDLDAFRAFLRALTVPTNGAPPRVLFVWPAVLTLEAVVTEVEFKHTQFRVAGGVLVTTATVNLEEATMRTPRAARGAR